MAATTKIWSNGIPPTCEDVDLNGFKLENNNLIVGAGIALSTADREQTHKAVAHYAGVGDFYVDSGAADAYVLSPTGVQVAPPTYATGMRIRFVAGNANTGPSTVNVATLGVKALVRDSDGSALAANDIPANVETRAYYDGTNFRVTSFGSLVIGSWTPTLFGTVTAGAPTYSIQTGHYYRIGNLVHIDYQVAISAIGGMVGFIKLASLPFSAKYRVRNAMATFQGLTTGFTDYQMSIQTIAANSDTDISISREAASVATVTDSMISSTFNITGQIFYEID